MEVLLNGSMDAAPGGPMDAGESGGLPEEVPEKAAQSPTGSPSPHPPSDPSPLDRVHISEETCQLVEEATEAHGAPLEGC